MPSVELLNKTENYMDLLSIACGQPYGNKVGEKGIKQIIKSGHLSVLEHCTASFKVKCSVRVLGQLTRHRHFSFTVKSSRGSTFDTFTLPSGSTVPIVNSNSCLPYLKALSQGMSEQDAAYFLPQGVQTTLVITGNLRAWFEYLPKRLCKRAMPEHQQLARLFKRELEKAFPEIFSGSFMNCEKCTERSCSFK